MQMDTCALPVTHLSDKYWIPHRTQLGIFCYRWRHQAFLSLKAEKNGRIMLATYHIDCVHFAASWIESTNIDHLVCESFIESIYHTVSSDCNLSWIPAWTKSTSQNSKIRVSGNWLQIIFTDYIYLRPICAYTFNKILSHNYGCFYKANQQTIY